MSKNTTKMAITYAFKELLLEKAYNKITVSDITQRCGINRQTFYYHFLDIPDMVEWICSHDVAKAINHEITYTNWKQTFLSIFELLKKDKAFIMNLYHHVPSDILTEYLQDAIYSMLIEILSNKCNSINVNEAEKEFIANFYKYGLVGLILDWVSQDMQEDPKIIINRLDSLIKGSLQKIFSDTSY